MLIPMTASVATDGQSRVKPSVYFIPIAQPHSQSPAPNNASQLIIPIFIISTSFTKFFSQLNCPLLGILKALPNIHT